MYYYVLLFINIFYLSILSILSIYIFIYLSIYLFIYFIYLLEDKPIKLAKIEMYYLLKI
jgi:hypothetical protein